MRNTSEKWDKAGIVQKDGTIHDTGSVSLRDRGDEDNNSIDPSELSGFVGLVIELYNKSRDARQSDENRWLRSFRNYRGLYGPDTQFTSKEKSQAFIKVTKTKILGAYAQITEILFSGSKFPIGIEPLKDLEVLPGDLEKAVHYDPEYSQLEAASKDLGVPIGETGTSSIDDRLDLRRDKLMGGLGPYEEDLDSLKEELKPGIGATASSFTFEPERVAAQKMEKLIHTQLDESDASKHLRSVVFELCLFGTGILKGPFASRKEIPRWSEEGDYTPTFKTIPKVEACSIWDIYPDPDSTTITDSEYLIQRHKLSRSQLNSLKKRPLFRKSSIDKVLREGSNYVDEWWEYSLDDSSRRSASIDRFEVLEFWGYIDSEIAKSAGINIPDDDVNIEDLDHVQVNGWICGGEIIRLVLNPFTPARIPYSIVPYELNRYSFFGVGVAENMADTQEIMNGFLRLAVDNAALSSNLLIEVDESALVPGQSLDVYPGKIFRRQSGPPGQSIFATKWPNLTGECIQVFDKARQLADEATGIPSFSHGQTGVTGIGRTASGISMLMGAAAQNIKAVIRNIDDYLLSPLGKSLYSFNQQFNFNKDIRGPLEVKARGTESLMRTEIRSQRLLEFIQITSNPLMLPFVKVDVLLRELASAMGLDEERILNDPRQAAIQAQLFKGVQDMMPPPQGGPTQVPGGEGGPPPGSAPVPGQQGFTGNEQPQHQQQQQPPAAAVPVEQGVAVEQQQ